MSRNIENKTEMISLEIRGKNENDPYQVIEDFFSASSLDHYRKYISSMLKAAYSEGYWKKSDPGSLLYFQEHMEGLIKASYLLVKDSESKKQVKRKGVLKRIDLSDEIDPSSYMGWHKNNTMWEFFPRNLSEREFINPYDAFERFFKYKSKNDWLKAFKAIISFALSPFGDDAVLEFDFLRINKYLQKLVEAAHLIDVRVNMPARDKKYSKGQTAEGDQDDKAENEDIHDHEDYPSDPYQIINWFFMDGTVDYGREDLDCLFKAAFPDEIISKKNYPSLLVFAFERMDKLIDAAYLISREKNISRHAQEDDLGDQVLNQVRLIYKKVGNWNYFPYKLRPIEWVNPRLAIKDFFEHQPLSHWKGKLHEILQASIRNESICEYMNDHSKLYWDCEQLERLVESMWLIKVLEL